MIIGTRFTEQLIAITIGLLLAGLAIFRYARSKATAHQTDTLRAIVGGFAVAALMLATVSSSFILAYGEVGALDFNHTQATPEPFHRQLAQENTQAQVTLVTPEMVIAIPKRTSSPTTSPTAVATISSESYTYEQITTHTPTAKPVLTATPSKTAVPATVSSTHTTLPTPPATKLATSTLVITTRPHAATVYAPRLVAPPHIDGHISDWGTLPISLSQPSYGARNWRGSSDQSGLFAIAWDVTHLYIAVQVEDDKHVQNQTGINIFKGDSVDVLLDTDLEGDYYIASLDEDDYQIGLSPGDLLRGRAKAQAYMWYPRTSSGIMTEVQLGSQLYGAAGFHLEAAIPWSVLGVSPSSGMVLGFVLSSNDNDHDSAAIQQTMLSVEPSRKLTDPTTWGTLVLTN